MYWPLLSIPARHRGRKSERKDPGDASIRRRRPDSARGRGVLSEQKQSASRCSSFAGNSTPTYLQSVPLRPRRHYLLNAGTATPFQEWLDPSSAPWAVPPQETSRRGGSGRHSGHHSAPGRVKATRRQRVGWRNALRRLSKHGFARLKDWTGRINYERPVFTGSRRTTENSDSRSVRELKNTIKERQKEDNYSELRSSDKTQQQR